MPRDSRTFDLGLFYGDQAGPGTSIPQSDSAKRCPFLDQQAGEFCSLDGDLCPFVGFNYRRCKKYTNNIARGALTASGASIPQRLSPNKPPRLESLTEAKKRGSRKTVADAKGKDQDFDAKYKKLKRDIEKTKKLLKVKVEVKSPPADEPEPEMSAVEKEKTNILATVFSYLLHTPGLTDEKGALTPEGKQEAEIFIYDLMANNVLRKPDAPISQYPKRVQDKLPLGKRTDGKVAQQVNRYANVKKKAYADRLTNLTLAHHKHNLEISVEGGSSKDLKQFSKSFLGLNTEILDKKTTDPGAWRDNVVNRGDFPIKGMHTTDDEIGKPFYGTAYSGYTTSPSAESNASPKVGPHDPGPLPDDIPSGERWSPPHPDSHPNASPATSAPPEEKAASEPSKKGKFHFSIRGKRDTQRTYSRAHETGLPQATRYARRPEQLQSWFDSLTTAQKRMLFDRTKYSPVVSEKKAMEKAAQLYSTNNVEDIAVIHKSLQEKLETAEAAIRKAELFDQAVKENYRRLKLVAPKSAELAEKIMKSEAAREQTAKTANKLLDNVFTYKTKKLQVGDQTVTQFLRDVSVPLLTKADYEVIRMNEQIAMAAVQTQHQYGRKFGKYSTVLAFFRDIISPLVALFLPMDSASKSEAMKYAQQLFGAPFWTRLYFSHIEKPLPKYMGSDSPVPSKDTKFGAAQKMSNPAASERIMGKFYNDPAGVYLPPSKAVLHSRSYPTTGERWGQVRDKKLTQRFKELVAPKSDWRKGFSRR